MFDQSIMPPRAGYAVLMSNDFMAIVRDTGEIINVLDDADSVLEHMSVTLSGGMLRQRVYVESAPGSPEFHELVHQGGDLLEVVTCSADQADHLQRLVASAGGSPLNG